MKKRWPLESVKTVIRRVKDQNAMCTDNDHQAKFKNSCVFRAHKEMILAVTRHMLTRDRKFRESKDYDGKDKPSRQRLMLRYISNSGPVISNEHTATEQIDNNQMDSEEDMPCHEHSLCV
jgi:hypothetical protein